MHFPPLCWWVVLAWTDWLVVMQAFPLLFVILYCSHQGTVGLELRLELSNTHKLECDILPYDLM